MRATLLVLLIVTSLSSSLVNPVQTKPEWKYMATLEDDRDSWKTYYDAAGIERHDKGISIKDYDRAEKLLGSDTRMDARFAPVPEHSLPGLILEAVCK